MAELLELRDQGTIRFLGMSGTIPNLADHIRMGVFDVFQIPRTRRSSRSMGS